MVRKTSQSPTPNIKEWRPQDRWEKFVSDLVQEQASRGGRIIPHRDYKPYQQTEWPRTLSFGEATIKDWIDREVGQSIDLRALQKDWRDYHRDLATLDWICKGRHAVLASLILVVHLTFTANAQAESKPFFFIQIADTQFGHQSAVASGAKKIPRNHMDFQHETANNEFIVASIKLARSVAVRSQKSIAAGFVHLDAKNYREVEVLKSSG